MDERRYKENECRKDKMEGKMLMKRYAVGEKIGSGLTANVYKGVDTHVCIPVAIKLLSMKQLTRLRLLQNVLREIQYR